MAALFDSNGILQNPAGLVASLQDSPSYLAFLYRSSQLHRDSFRTLPGVGLFHRHSLRGSCGTLRWYGGILKDSSIRWSSGKFSPPDNPVFTKKKKFCLFQDAGMLYQLYDSCDAPSGSVGGGAEGGGLGLRKILGDLLDALRESQRGIKGR